MFLTHGQPFVNLDSVIDVDALLKIRPLLSAFVAQHFHLMQPARYSQHNLWSRKIGMFDLYDFYQKNLPADADLIPIVQQLKTTNSLGNWCMFEHNVEVGGLTINLRPTVNMQNKHLSAHCRPLPEDQHFQVFYQWLDAQQIFEQYGVVRIFINLQNTYTMLHKDHGGTDAATGAEFIWLGLSPHKNLYIYDVESENKVYASGVANWFESNNWHGSDPAKQACYSIRVDGIFSDHFKQRMAASQRPS